MKLKNILLISLSAASLMACNSGSSGATDSSSLGATSITVGTVGAEAALAEKTIDCSGVSSWNKSGTYTAGSKVVYNNVEYQAGWWTRGDQPDTNSDAGEVWTVVGNCSNVPSPTPSASPTPTPKPTTSPTPSPTASPTSYVQYPNDISSYAAGTIVYGVKDNKNTPDGKLYKCKSYPYSGWCKGAASAYAPGYGTAWSDAWDSVDNPTPSPTTSPKPTPRSSPTPETYAAYSDDVDVRASYTTGTVVYLKYYNVRYYFKCKVAGWCQIGGAYEPLAKGEAWKNAWEVYNNMSDLPTYNKDDLYFFNGMMVYGSDGHIYQSFDEEGDVRLVYLPDPVGGSKYWKLVE